RGHGDGSYSIDIRISPGELGAFRSLVLGRTAPKGIVAVAFHSKVGTNAPGSTYAMQKRDDGAWQYLVAEAGGAIVAEGRLPLCAQCPAAAPADSLFVPAPLAKPEGPSPQ